MNEISRIEDQLSRAFDGDAWHGPSLQAILAGVTVDQALAKPIPGVHSIWEIVLHIIAWQGAVRIRLEDGYVDLPAEGDWPEISDMSEAGWQNTLTALEHSHQELRQAIARLNDDRLDERLGSERERATGGGVSVYVTLHGIVQHNIYHGGQIALLKKAGE